MGRSVRGRRAGWGLSWTLTPTLSQREREEGTPTQPSPVHDEAVTGEDEEEASRIQYDYAE